MGGGEWSRGTVLVSCRALDVRRSTSQSTDGRGPPANGAYRSVGEQPPASANGLVHSGCLGAFGKFRRWSAN